MKIHSYTICHYGVQYINSALQSVLPFVEQAHIFYTPNPSHGHQSSVRPVETKEEIYKEVRQLKSAKVRWHNAPVHRIEGNQRDFCVNYLKSIGVDIVIILDYDEVWPKQTLQAALEAVKDGGARNWLVNMTHLWRSFNHACKDNGWPVRFIDLREDDNSNGYIPKEWGDIYHFGYAITDEVMRYKWQIHGHKNEMREGWLDNEWKNSTLFNCHPTNSRDSKTGKAFWDADPFDKNKLPEFMREHRFWGMDKIK